MTWAPAAASADAVARPIPREAPVTKAVLLRRAAIFFYLRFRRRVPSRHVPPSSRVQKQRRVFDEELRVLVVRAVIGVGVDDQLSIRDVLLHNERVHRGYVHVVTAVHDECWLLDRLQIVVGPLLPDAPLANRFDLGGLHSVVHFNFASNLTRLRALQER